MKKSLRLNILKYIQKVLRMYVEVLLELDQEIIKHAENCNNDPYKSMFKFP